MKARGLEVDVDAGISTRNVSGAERAVTPAEWFVPERVRAGAHRVNRIIFLRRHRK